MAGIGGLPYFIQYQGQLQEQARAQQDQQMRAQAFAQQQQQWQQAQQDRQRAQAAQTAAGNALPQLLAGGQVAAQPQGQMPPPPQPPAPGQASQPMQQPQGAAPMPGQGPAPGGVQPPLPPGGIPQGAQGQLPPFRPMPTTPPQSAAPQGAIPAPPAQAAATPTNDQMEGGFSLSNIIQSGQKQGLSGSDLYDYVQTLEPYMTAQQKQKAEQFKTQLELKKLDAEIALHSQAAQNQQLSLQERARHDEALERLATQRIGVAERGLDVRREVAGLATGGGAPPADTGKVGPDGLPIPVGGGGLTGPATRVLSLRVRAGDPTALTGQSRAARAAVMNDVAKLDSGSGADIAGNQIDFAAARKGAQTATQREANIATSEKAIINPGGLADQVLDAARKTYRTGSPALNQKINYVLANYGGDPAVVDLKNALGDLEGQFNKAMAGGGASTDAARAETIARINDAQTIPQLEAAINRMKLGLQKEGEAAQETSKMFADRVRQAGKVGGKKETPAAGGAPAIPQGWSVTEH